jgi:DNA primase
MNIKDLIEETGYTPKKKASTHGGEYCSPCPFCREGNDRFLIWPNRPNKNGEYQGGRFSCRVCGKYGDAITFLRELHGLSYKEACTRLRIEPKKRDVTSTAKRKIKLPTANDPPELWQSKGKAFVEWCHAQLVENETTLNLVKRRGFSLESIKRFKLGFNMKVLFRDRKEWGLEPEIKEDGKLKKLWLSAGIVIPTFVNGQVIKIKIRRSDWKEGDKLPKYVEVSGSKPSPSVYGDLTLKVALILESELDSLLIQQEAGDLVYCIALGGSTKPIDLHTDQLLRQTSILLFCPDFDRAGAVAWAKWKKMFPAIQRILTPDGKSAGDAYLAGVNLREWLIASLQSI